MPESANHAAGARAPAPSSSGQETDGEALCPWWQVGLVTLGIWALGWLGLRLSTITGEASPLWPAAGLGVWAVTRRGWRMLLAVGVGGILGKWDMESGWIVLVATGGSMLEAGCGRWLWGRARELSIWEAEIPKRGVAYFCLGLLAPVPAALLTPSALALSGAVAGADLGATILTWWSGDVFGILLLVPLIDAWGERRSTGLAGSRGWGWGLATALATIVACVIAFWPSTPGGGLFAVFPPLLLAKRWRSFLGVHLTALVIVVVAVLATLGGHGPFHDGQLTNGLLRMEAFLLSVVLTALALPLFRTAGNVRLGIAVLMGGWLTGAVIYHFQRNTVQKADRAHLAAEVNSTMDALVDRVTIYTEALRAGEALFRSSGAVDLDEWRRFSATLRLQESFPGINGIGVIWPVTEAERPAFEARLTRESHQPFQIHAVPNVVAPTPAPGEARHYVIGFIEPVDINRAAVGLDVGSESTRRAGADAARDSGQARITRRIVLVQDGKQRAGFLLYLPVYQRGAPLRTPAERRAAFSHWVYAPFITEQFVEGALATATQELTMDLYQGQSTAAADLLYTVETGVTRPYDAVSEIQLAGQTFTLGWRKTARFASPDATAPAWIGSGLALASLALAGLVTVLQSSHQRAQVLVAERTRELKSAHEQMADLAAWQAGVLDSNHLAIISADPQGVIRSFNAGAERMLGYSREEVIGRATPAIWHKEEEVQAQAERLSQQLRRPIAPDFGAFVALANRGQTEAREWTYVRKDGQELPVSLTVSAIRNPDGDIVGFLGIAQDLTERKRAEAGRRAALVELTTLKGALDQHVEMVVIDPAGLITYANAQFCSNSGYAHEELVGQSFGFLEAGTQSPDVRAAMWDTVREGRNWRGDIQNRAKDGRLYWVDTLIVPEPNPQGQVRRFVALQVDVTRNRDYEQGLARARDEALDLARLKSEFLANISHELRTPMNGVIGMAELLVESDLAEEPRNMAELIYQSGENLLTIINDILDLSKMEAGKMRLSEQPFDLAAMLHSTLELLVPRSETKHLSLRCEIAPEAHWNVIGDEGRLRQVVVNLLGNALKFTDAGTITLRLLPLKSYGRRLKLRIEVEDTGCGIPVAMQSRLFQSFVQVDGSHTRVQGGTGLGLAISRQIVEMMGGRIGVDSEPGLGSTFWFELKLERGMASAEGGRVGLASFAGAAAAGDTVPPMMVNALDVLLVEDNPANQEVARLMLKRLGHQVVVAADGEQGLARLAERRFDAVFMDCQMPVLDGFEATRRLRAGQVPGADPTVPVIALTAYAMAGDRDRCLAVGMNHYLSKPLRKRDVATALASVMKGRPTPGARLVDQARSDPERVLDQEVVNELSSLTTETGESVFAFVAGHFLQTYEEELSQLRALAEASSWEMFRLRVHRFGGSAAALGGVELRRVTLEFERWTNQEQAEQVLGRWEELVAASGRLVKVLRAVPAAASGER